MKDRLIAGGLLASRQHLFNYDGQFSFGNHVTKQTILIRSPASRCSTLQPACQILAIMGLGILCKNGNFINVVEVELLYANSARDNKSAQLF
jgi:hypothetical protein